MDLMRIKILLRLLCELMNAFVLSTDDIMTTYEIILDQVHKKQDQTEEIKVNHISLSSAFLKDCLVFVCVASLPWGTQRLIQDSEQRFERLLTRINNHVTKSTSTHQTLISSWEQFYKNGNYKNGSRALLKTSDYFEESFIKETNRRGFAVTQEQLFNHTQVPSTHVRWYRGRMGMYESIIKEQYPGDRTIAPYDQLIVEEYISDMIYFFNSSYKLLMKHMYDVPLNLMTQAIVSKEELEANLDATQEMEFEKALTQRADLIFDLMVIDSVLGHMLKINPTSPHQLQYYISTLIEMIKQDGEHRIPLVQIYMDLIQKDINTLDVEASFVKIPHMMATLLLNISLKWNWTEWEKDVDDYKQRWLSCVFEKIIQFTSLEQLKESIKDTSLESALPKEVDESNKPNQSTSTIIKESSKDDVDTLKQALDLILDASKSSIHVLRNHLVAHSNNIDLLQEAIGMETSNQIILGQIRTHYWSNQHFEQLCIQTWLNQNLLKSQHVVRYLLQDEQNIATDSFTKMDLLCDTWITQLISKSIVAHQKEDTKQFNALIDEFLESMYTLLIELLLSVKRANQNETHYKYALGMLTKVINRWQRYCPNIESYIEQFLNDQQFKTAQNVSNDVKSILRKNKYYEGVNSQHLCGKYLNQEQAHEVDNRLVAALYDREKSESKSAKILNSFVGE
ncbi:hypothetical protein AKO1_008603 [Acrasis kona]|uniref:MIF4G-like type 1 domain-containing protein n=1 Tax=Acrasis kona TaxID=1008807 RepID=A0AAW2YN05_9EUKA